MNNSLFNEFDSVSSKAWKQKIQFDLKGADYNDTLIWQSNEDISVKPFYHADCFDELPACSETKATQWHIGQRIYVANAEKANLKANRALEKGTESIIFIIPSKDIVIKNLIKNIDTSTVLFFELQFLSKEFVQELSTLTSKFKTNIQIDIIGNLCKSGNWYTNLTEDHITLENIVHKTNTISIDTCVYQNAGANMVQQLAYALAHVNEYFNHFFFNKKMTSGAFNIIFKVSVGTNYFFEIAKLRALRKLWYSIALEYNLNPECHIMAKPTKRNKTLYDYNTNMLRTTTECMSAILGGANTICNLPYDSIYHKSNGFGERIARNQLLILKHESYFDKVDNPADGSYYIESLTTQLAEKALDLFKNIESTGGFLKQLKEGTIQRKIKERANKEQIQFNEGEEILLGTNKHPNPKDTMRQELEIYPFVKTNKRKTLIEPIIEKRLAEKLEQDRLNNE